MSENNTIACDQSRNLVFMVDRAAQQHNIEIFVVEKPPRGDSEESDPNRVLTTCNVSSNGIFPSLITPLEKVHYIHLPSLHNLTERSKKNMFTTDGIHLKPFATKLLTNDIVAGVKAVFKDLKKDGSKHIQKGGNKKSPDNSESPDNFLLDGKQHTFREKNSRGSQEPARRMIDENNQPDGTFGYQEESRWKYKHNRQKTDRRNVDLLPSGRNEKNRFHPQDSWGNGSDPFFHPLGRIGSERNGRNQEYVQSGGWKGNNWKDSSPEYFHPAGRSGSGSNPQYVQSGGWKGNERKDGSPEFSHSAGRTGYETKNKNTDHIQSDRRHHVQQVGNQRFEDKNGISNRGVDDRNTLDQKDGMPDLVKEYLMKTLMKEKNGRY